MWATGAEASTRALEIADDAERRTRHRVRGYVIAPDDADLSGRVFCDADEKLAAAHGFAPKQTGSADRVPAARLGVPTATSATEPPPSTPTGSPTTCD